MTNGYQIYMYNPNKDKCFGNAGLHNWFPTYEQAVKRREELLESWGKYVQYIIVDCSRENECD